MKGRVKENKANPYYRSGVRAAQAEINDESGGAMTQPGPPQPDKPGPSDLPFVDDIGRPIEHPPPDPMEGSVIRRYPHNIPGDAPTTPGLDEQWDVPMVLAGGVMAIPSLGRAGLSRLAGTGARQAATTLEAGARWK